MDETECVLPAKLRSKARRAMSASGAVSGASSDLVGGSSDDNETPRPPPPAVALFEQVCLGKPYPYHTVSAWAHRRTTDAHRWSSDGMWRSGA